MHTVRLEGAPAHVDILGFSRGAIAAFASNVGANASALGPDRLRRARARRGGARGGRQQRRGAAAVDARQDALHRAHSRRRRDQRRRDGDRRRLRRSRGAEGAAARALRLLQGPPSPRRRAAAPSTAPGAPIRTAKERTTCSRSTATTRRPIRRCGTSRSSTWASCEPTPTPATPRRSSSATRSRRWRPVAISDFAASPPVTSVVPGSLVTLEGYLDQIQAPAWPASFPAPDATLAARGETVYQATCAGCHDATLDASGLYDPQVLDVGTDHNLITRYLATVDVGAPIGGGTLSALLTPVVRQLDENYCASASLSPTACLQLDDVYDATVNPTGASGARRRSSPPPPVTRRSRPPACGPWRRSSTTDRCRRSPISSRPRRSVPATFAVGHSGYDTTRLGLGHVPEPRRDGDRRRRDRSSTTPRNRATRTRATRARSSAPRCPPTTGPRCSSISRGRAAPSAATPARS